MPARPLVALFDFDGTLVDSDAALGAPWAALGVPVDRVPPPGLPLVEACELARVTVADYLGCYDASSALPFQGVQELLDALDRWGIASNKQRRAGRLELERLGWSPTAALFTEDFGGLEKELPPLLAALHLQPAQAIFVGDTHHDRACALAAGVRFAVAGWNPRARAGAEPGDTVLDHPADVLELL